MRTKDPILNSCGIYKIINKNNGKYYVGSTRTSFRIRWAAHRCQLNQNKHWNKHLQSAWNIDGKEAFQFVAVEILPKDKDLIVAKEQEYIDKAFEEEFSLTYNFAKVAKLQKGFKRTLKDRQQRSEATKAQFQDKVKKAKWLESFYVAHLTGFEFTMVSPEGKEYSSIPNFRAFCAEHGIESRNVYKILRGDKAISVKGWTVKGFQRDKRGYERTYNVVLIAPDGTEHGPITGLAKLCRDNGLQLTNIVKMIKGGRKSHKGWKLKAA